MTPNSSCPFMEIQWKMDEWFFKANTLASMDNISDPIFIIAKINGLFRFSEQDQKDLKKKDTQDWKGFHSHS